MAQNKNKTLQIVVRCIIAVLLCAVLYTAVFFVAVKIQNPNAVPMPFGFGASRSHRKYGARNFHG